MRKVLEGTRRVGIGEMRQTFVQMAGRPLEDCEQAATFGSGDLMHGKISKQMTAFVQATGRVRAGTDLEHRRWLCWGSSEGC